MLTKPEQFLKDLAKEYHLNGRNISLAYKTLRPKVKDSTAKVEGSKALTNPNFQGFLKKLEKESQLRYGINMEEIVQGLKDIFFNPEISTKCKIQSADILIKIAGEYAPTKQEVKTEVTLPTDIKFTDI